jgi:predicted lipoprotein with Yx(FWY)xxD motif
VKPIALLATAAVLALAGCGSDNGYGGGGSSNSSSSTGSGDTAQISTAKNDKLGQTVLVDGGGMTIYALSAEKGGKFICTDSKCLSAWTPIPGKTSGDVGSLAMVKRPDGKQQATYKGQALYTFNGDKAKGDANGEGFKDVGTWHAVTVAGKPASSSGSGGSSSGGGGGGGY